MTPASAQSYKVEAYNLSHASENKIHDDSVAQKLGFTGGLVPGVEVFAYMTNPVVAQWGQAWLQHGRMQASFNKPLYDGCMAEVTAKAAADGSLELALASDGVSCASGNASLPAAAKAPALDDFALRLPPPVRPPADETSLATGAVLCTKPAPLTPQRHADYLRDVRERLPIYASAGIAHPGLLLRLCNSTLVENVVLAPWIHISSEVQNFSVARVGDEIGARARVLRNYEQKGHRVVDLDVAVVANGAVVGRVLHRAIYKLRHLTA